MLGGISWRIRRAAVGVITAFVHARSDILKDSYPLVCRWSGVTWAVLRFTHGFVCQMLDVVIKRFAERESSVRGSPSPACRCLSCVDVARLHRGGAELLRPAHRSGWSVEQGPGCAMVVANVLVPNLLCVPNRRNPTSVWTLRSTSRNLFDCGRLCPRW